MTPGLEDTIVDRSAYQRNVERLRELFAESLHQDGKMCLCGLLAAESGGLPEPVAEAAKTFFAALVDRLVSAFPDSDDPLSDALAVLATLEGGYDLEALTSCVEVHLRQLLG